LNTFNSGLTINYDRVIILDNQGNKWFFNLGSGGVCVCNN